MTAATAIAPAGLAVLQPMLLLASLGVVVVMELLSAWLIPRIMAQRTVNKVRIVAITDRSCSCTLTRDRIRQELREVSAELKATRIRINSLNTPDTFAQCAKEQRKRDKLIARHAELSSLCH